MLPFQTAALSPGGPLPTTSQKLAETHDTAPTGENPVRLVPADQDDPFQASTRPIASIDMQKSTLEQDTNCPWRPPAPGLF